MLTRLAGASVRAALVAAAVAIPALTLPEVSNHSAELAILLASIAAAFVIIEYGFTSPSLIEFRFAAPYNRLRFAMFAALVMSLTVIFRQTIHETGSSIVLSNAGRIAFETWDFTGSPVRSILLLAEAMGEPGRTLVGTAAAVAMTITVLTLGVFAFLVAVFSWPLNHDKFNLWINMPTIDANAGNAMQMSIRQSAFISLIIGLTLPYLAPQAAMAFMGPLEPVSTGNSLFFIWMIAIWCFVPAVSVFRSIALYKVAHLMAQDEMTQAEVSSQD